ncbi:UDP-N-acetylmuramyl pentapeptide phosphotransferase/UDP-N-acetylglucosamine-1-phosphate transferase [Chamaesiphon minutus PCC 6605]|uniref:UDP-N-acetylmuramyl pentapeptide phosphotransferase/UDP-N-acetylglucosamine-1-phosphate transferase n=2 Tax=Chamaesiphon TaxID=217161 RepID=K9UM79_CHAP6|nr:UDP-N-acetylmuramyl pentapeptide phosphotransferase/UDP-N-acetylglucosamine-1-phosphate transferase [Chamaesiphon minutus PCC 6605]
MNSIGVADPHGRGWLSVVLTFMFAWIVTYLFIPKVRTFALKVGWADEPNARRLHQEPRPNAGGLAIYTGVMAAIILAGCLAPIVLAKVQVSVLAILLGGSVLVLVGFIDDQFGGLPALFRLLVQVLTALLLVVCGIQIHLVYFGAPIDGIISVAFTVLWIVGITNAVNLMDGIDGLAGGVSFITAMSLLAASAQFEARAAATLICAGAGGAALGFLRHNYHPSRIFMGDAGAYFLGYVLAATSILGNVKMTTLTSLLGTIVFFIVPVVDTSQVIVKRLLSGTNPMSTPGKDHLHHRLLAQGFSQRHSAVILWGVTLAGGMIAMRMQGIRQTAIVVTAIGIALLLVMTVWLRLRAIVDAPDKPISNPDE